ncbi:hypothetical protein ACOSQ4_028757 [Xanthoceras sorbifolium]
MPLFCEESPLNPKFIIFSQSPQLLHSLALSESESLTSQIHATSLLACRNHHSSNMCRYRAWEDDIPDGEVYEQNHEEHRNEATDFLLQLEECMNEMREMIDSIKEINKPRSEGLRVDRSSKVFDAAILTVHPMPPRDYNQGHSS